MLSNIKPATSIIKERILPLDGLRAVAILMVLGFHFLNNQYGQMDIATLNTLEKILMKSTYFGWCGVDLFFVLSGFLIASILFKNRGSSNFFKAFYVRRFVRIVPIYYLLLLIFLACKYAPWYDAGAYIFEKEIPIGYYFLFLQNFMMSAAGNFGAEALTPTWSLAIEEQFYLIIPLVIYFLKPKYILCFILFCLIVAPVSRYMSVNWYQKYTLLSSRIDSPAMGVLVAYIMQKEKFRNYVLNNSRLLKFISLVTLSLCGLIYVFSDPGIFNHSLIAFNFAIILIIVLNSNKGFVYSFLTNKIFIQIGGLSYFIYLYHQLINGTLHLVVLKHKVPVLDSISAILISIAALAITWILAKISFRYFETPLITYSHSIKY
jgi:peptidoglycan/LPS O-acetylase OafA/YrhL